MDKISVNPFVHRLQFRKLDYFKMFLGSIFLFPIRSVLALLLFLISSLLAKIFLCILERWNLSEDEKIKWKATFKKPCVILMRALFFVCGFYRLRLNDKSGTSENGASRILVVAPHTSLFDVAIGLVLGRPSPSPVARHDAVDIWFFGNLIRLTDPIFVKRDSPLSRQNVYINVLEKLQHNSVIFFPEGTCSNHKVFAQFKSGAFKIGLSIQPLLIKYDQYGGPDTLTWTWDGPGAIKQIWLTLSRWSTGFELIKLPLYVPNEQEKQDPQLYANNVCQLMAKELGMSTSFYLFDDLLFFNDLNTLRSPTCLKFMKLCQKVIYEVPIEKIAELNGHVNESSNVTSVEKRKWKKRITAELAQKIIENILNKFKKLTSVKKLNSSNELQEFLDLKHYEFLNNSASLSQLLQCLEKVPDTSTIHMAVILKLCDSRKPNLWDRFEDCFQLLKEDKDNAISFQVFKNFLWLALGFDKVDDNFQINEAITFEYLKRNLVPLFRRAVEENASQLLHNK